MVLIESPDKNIPAAGEFTQLLHSSGQGDKAATERLIEAAYPELRRIARAYLRREATDELQATSLVNEAFVRLLGGAPVDYVDRVHFFATAARQMRRILVDNARKRRTAAAAEGELMRRMQSDRKPSVFEMAELVDRLAVLDARAAEIVDLRYWGGLSKEEVATELGISLSTVQRDWDFARLWLASEYQRCKQAPPTKS